MPCAAFEDLLSGYDELTSGQRQSVNAHLAVCADCREHLAALAALDRELAALYQGLQPHAGFAAGVLSRTAAIHKPLGQPHPPSAWPEVLDFCGWAAIVAIVALLAVTAAAQAGIALAFPPYAGWSAAAAVAVAVLLALAPKTKSAVNPPAR
jgi:anti-sigma factor RsiW